MSAKIPQNTQTFTQQKEHCDWLILGHAPLIKFKCIKTGMLLVPAPDVDHAKYSSKGNHALYTFCLVFNLNPTKTQEIDSRNL